MIKIGIHNCISVGCLGIELGTSRSSKTGSINHVNALLMQLEAQYHSAKLNTLVVHN